MHTDHAVTRMSSYRVAMRPIVDRMTDASENITFPCGELNWTFAENSYWLCPVYGLFLRNK